LYQSLIIQARALKQNEAEENLDFLGFALLQNRAKPESAPVIDELRRAGMRCVMVTGDNILTACTVARECRLVEQNDVFSFVRCVSDGCGVHSLVLEADTDADAVTDVDGTVSMGAGMPGASVVCIFAH
jgi:magnesium-transporting ATPase (P-type)